MSDEDSRKRKDEQEPRSQPDMANEAYPKRQEGVMRGLSRMGNLFTLDDWLNVLTRSRSSFEDTRRAKKVK